MLAEEVATFLKGVPALQFLDEGSLRRVAESSFQDFYPKGYVIHAQGGPPCDALCIVITGGAKIGVTSGEGAEIILDYRSPGDVIGFLSLYSGDRSRTTVTALEDTTCYLLPREVFLPLLDENPSVREYFNRTFLAKYVDKAFSDMRSRSLLFGSGERLLFTTAVAELIGRAPVTAPDVITIREAAAIMSRNRISSLVLTGPGDGPEGGAPTGIVTDRDLRDKVAAPGLDPRVPVADIMSTGLITVEVRDYCFDALVTMIRHGIHHLLVLEAGRLAGIVTDHDLMILQGTSPISVVREIEGQKNLEGLTRASDKVNDIIGLLLRDGAKASNITRVITEINDRIVRKAVELAQQRLGPPPLPWCWMVFGSEGRREQTFRTDQDNAIVYADPRTPEETEAARDWFTRLAALMRESLMSCGFSPCPADFMASNPRWTKPLSTWKERFSSWIENPGPDALLNAVILFDFRGLAGTVALAEELRGHLNRALAHQNVFLARLAGTVTRNRPPLGFFGAFVVEKDGEHQDELNLKISGLGPIVDIARHCALTAGIDETGTLERLRALKGRHPLVTEFGGELGQAFEFLALMRIARQWEQLQAGRPIGNFINPESLTTYEKKSLKDAFRLISRVQDFLVEEYRGGLVGS